VLSSKPVEVNFSCECPKSFDGPRCQQLRHSFSGNGWAQYKTLSQCGNGTTSIEVMTAQSNGIILYNGPNTDPGMLIPLKLMYCHSAGSPVLIYFFF